MACISLSSTGQGETFAHRRGESDASGTTCRADFCVQFALSEEVLMILSNLEAPQEGTVPKAARRLVEEGSVAGSGAWQSGILQGLFFFWRGCRLVVLVDVVLWLTFCPQFCLVARSTVEGGGHVPMC